MHFNIINDVISFLNSLARLIFLESLAYSSINSKMFNLYLSSILFK